IETESKYMHRFCPLRLPLHRRRWIAQFPGGVDGHFVKYPGRISVLHLHVLDSTGFGDGKVHQSPPFYSPLARQRRVVRNHLLQRPKDVGTIQRFKLSFGIWNELWRFGQEHFSHGTSVLVFDCPCDQLKEGEGGTLRLSG